MNEHGFITSIHRPLKRDPDIDIWKINVNFANGVPDAWYIGTKQDLWVEYKYLKYLPKKPDTLIKLTNAKQFLSKPQQQWLERKHKLGAKTAVILGVENEALIFEGLSWKTPVSSRHAKKRGIPRSAVSKWIRAFCT